MVKKHKYKDKDDYKDEDKDKDKDAKGLIETLTVCYIFGILTVIDAWAKSYWPGNDDRPPYI